MLILDETEVVIIGTGVIGCAIAYYLAGKGINTIVLEANTIGSGTSSATFGLVWTQSKEPVEYMELNRTSALLHAQLARSFDEDVELRQKGGLIISLNETDYKKQIEITDRLNRSKLYQAKALTPEKVREIEPYVSEKIAGGIYSPNDGHINPIKLVINLAKNAKRRGAKFGTV
jgi:sarcosine oxidase subunit beta